MEKASRAGCRKSSPRDRRRRARRRRATRADPTARAPEIIVRASRARTTSRSTGDIALGDIFTPHGIGNIFGAVLGGVFNVGRAVVGEIAEQHSRHQKKLERQRTERIARGEGEGGGGASGVTIEELPDAEASS